MSKLRALVRVLAAALVVLALSSPAHAQRTGLDNQIKLHVGLSAVSGPGVMGVTAGIDSRLGRLAFVDFGAFVSPGSPDVVTGSTEDPQDAFRLRHGITLTPGLRIPHRQPETFRWDVLVRAGPSVIWAAYDGPRASGVSGDLYEVDAAIVAGPELHLARGPFGVRATGRVFVTRAYSRQERNDVLTWLPQLTVEASYQFQGLVRDAWREFTKGR